MDRKQDKKHDILQCGLEIMLRNGYNGTGIKDIVDAACIPKGSFYNYFESKESFVLQALNLVFTESLQSAKTCLQDSSKNPLQRIEAFFAAGVEQAKQKQYQCGCFMGNMCQEMADVNEPIRVSVDKMFTKTAQMIEGCLSEAQNQGQLSMDRDVTSLSEFLLLAWEGALLRAKAAKSDFPLKAFMKQLEYLL